MQGAMQAARDVASRVFKPTLVESPDPSQSDTPPPPSQRAPDRTGVTAASSDKAAAAHHRLLPAWMQLSAALRLAPPWTKWPDYNRCSNLNAVVASLWPYLSPAIEQLAREQLEPTLRDAVAQLGRGILTGLELESFDLGSHPPQVSALKSYTYGEDELAFEAHMVWASDSKFTLAATLALPLLQRPLRVPLTVEAFQFAALARVTLFPLLEAAPFAGSATITLLEAPHVDFELPVTVAPPFMAPLRLDLLALPLVADAFRLGVALASQALLVYPKGYTYELFPGGSRPPQPAGMLVVRLVRIAGLRSEDLVGESDPYCVLQVRDGRRQRSRTVLNNNNPEFDEEFTLLVDDPDRQSFRVVVMDDDWGMNDTLLGVADLRLSEAAFMAAPRTKLPLTLVLQKVQAPPQSAGLLALPGTLATAPLRGIVAAGRALASEGARNEREAHGGRASAGASTSAAASSGRSSPSHALSERDYAPSEASDADGRAAAPGRGGGGLRRSGSEPQLAPRAAAAPERPERVGAGGGRHAPHLPGREQREAERGQGGQHHALAQAGQALGSAVAGVAAAAAPEGARGGGGAGAATEGGSSAEAALEGVQAQEEGGGRGAIASSAAGAGRQRHTQLQPKVMGTVFLEALYIPFRSAVAAPGSGFGWAIPVGGDAARPATRQTAAGPLDKGILTVTLNRATHLAGWSGEADPYSVLEVSDPESRRRQSQQSSTLFNEPNPRWAEKFDFVMISATSRLKVTVMDRTTTWEKVSSLRLSKRFQDVALGHVRVAVADVVRAGRVHHTWPLQGAEQGSLDMVLQWFPSSLAET